MARDDYFKIIYVILTELYESKRDGRKADERAISAERFGIPVFFYTRRTYAKTDILPR